VLDEANADFVQAHIKRAITAGDMRPLPPTVSPEACAFVAAMLTPDANQRPDAGMLLQHPFLARLACGSPRRWATVTELVPALAGCLRQQPHSSSVVGVVNLCLPK
jgi:hypothetical protein